MVLRYSSRPAIYFSERGPLGNVIAPGYRSRYRRDPAQAGRPLTGDTSGPARRGLAACGPRRSGRGGWRAPASLLPVQAWHQGLAEVPGGRTAQAPAVDDHDGALHDQLISVFEAARTAGDQACGPAGRAAAAGRRGTGGWPRPAAESGRGGKRVRLGARIRPRAAGRNGRPSRWYCAIIPVGCAAMMRSAHRMEETPHQAIADFRKYDDSPAS